MVRVISTQPEPTAVKRKVHMHCGATLEYLPFEVQRDYSTDYTGGKDWYNYIPCPNCGQRCHV